MNAAAPNLVGDRGDHFKPPVRCGFTAESYREISAAWARFVRNRVGPFKSK